MRAKVERVAKWGGLVAALAAVYGIARAFIPDALGAALSSPPSPPPYVVCNASCDAARIRIGQAYVVVKPSATARASTITPADDPHLVLTSVPAGTYLVRAVLITSNATASSGGFRMALSPVGVPMTATSCAANQLFTASANALGSPGSGGGQVPAATYTAANIGVAVECEGLYVNASSASVAVSWAQAVSSAVNSQLEANSALILVRLK